VENLTTVEVSQFKTIQQLFPAMQREDAIVIETMINSYLGNEIDETLVYNDVNSFIKQAEESGADMFLYHYKIHHHE
jgi:membrane-bound lytic murein transglycosylase MltF